MKCKAEIEVTRDMSNAMGITEEYLCRVVARELVTNMPIDELRKLFKIKKIDPFSQESKLKLCDYSTPEHERMKILSMQELHVLIYEAQCDI